VVTEQIRWLESSQ